MTRSASSSWSMARPGKDRWLAFVMDLIYLFISTPVPMSLCCREKKKLINTFDQWLQRFSLNLPPFSTGCHSPLAAQTHLIPTGDSYSLSGFPQSVESKALPVVHSEGFWQEVIVLRRAELRDPSVWIETEEKVGGGGGTVERPVCENACRGCAQEIIKQQLVKGLSCSTAVKGPWWCDTRLSRWMWLLALVIDSPILFDTGRLSSTGSVVNGGLAFERKPRDLLAD